MESHRRISQISAFGSTLPIGFSRVSNLEQTGLSRVELTLKTRLQRAVLRRTFVAIDVHVLWPSAIPIVWNTPLRGKKKAEF
jgi:hypothetical protein